MALSNPSRYVRELAAEEDPIASRWGAAHCLRLKGASDAA